MGAGTGAPISCGVAAGGADTRDRLAPGGEAVVFGGYDGGVARRIFSIGCLHTTHIGRGPCSTLSAQSTHIAMWPHGTSRFASVSAPPTTF